MLNVQFRFQDALDLIVKVGRKRSGPGACPLDEQKEIMAFLLPKPRNGQMRSACSRLKWALFPKTLEM